MKSPDPNTPSQSDISREDKILYIVFIVLMLAIVYLGIATHQDELTLLNSVLGILSVLFSITAFYTINKLVINTLINNIIKKSVPSKPTTRLLPSAIPPYKVLGVKLLVMVGIILMAVFVTPLASANTPEIYATCEGISARVSVFYQLCPGAGLTQVYVDSRGKQTTQGNGDLLNIGIIDEHSCKLQPACDQISSSERLSGRPTCPQTAFPSPAYTRFNQGDDTEDYLEDCIFQENLRADTQNHFTLVIATTLSRTTTDTNNSASVGDEELRGAYLAQLENNYDKNAQYKLRLAIANLGVKDAAQTTVPLLAQRIVAYKNQSAPNDHFIGVVGFPFSGTAAAAFLNNQNQFDNSNILSQSQVLTISSSASSDYLQNISGLYYHIVPLNDLQTPDTIDFITNDLHSKHVLIVHADDPYSQTLGNDISEGLQSRQIPSDILPYQGHTFTQALKELGSNDYDLIYFAGYSDDLNALKQALREQHRDIPIIGGEALYELGGYTGNNYSNIYFTTFYFHDAPDPVDFTSDYQRTFDPENEHPGQYGYQLAGPHAALAHDAVGAYTTEVQAQAFSGADSLSDQVRQQMSNNTFVGAAGYTNLKDADSHMNRKMYVVCVNSDGHTQELVDYQPPLDQNTSLGTPIQKQPLTVCT